jgi:hypothetical protein
MIAQWDSQTTNDYWEHYIRVVHEADLVTTDRSLSAIRRAR